MTFARALRAAGDRAAALALEEKILKLPLPAAWPERRDEAASLADDEIGRRFALWSSIPVEDRPVLQAAWDACLEMLREAARVEPLVALFLFERETAAHLDAQGEVADLPDADPSGAYDEDDDDEDDDDEEDEDGDDEATEASSEASPGAWLASELENLPRWIRALGAAPPAGYVDLVLDAVRHAGPQMGGYNGLFQVLEQRMFALGPRASAGLADVLAWGQQWCVGSSRGVNTQLAVRFGKLLMWMGLEDVPAFIHAAHRDNEYMVEDFYPQWAAAAPQRRLARFLDGFTTNAAQFDEPTAWEDVIYDSEPGIAMLVHAITGTKKADAKVDTSAAVAKLAVAAQRPGPLLTKLVYKVADHFVVQAWPHVRALLEAMPALDPEHATLLRQARTSDVIAMLDAGKDASVEIERLRAQYPEHPVPRFLEARNLLAHRSEAAAAECTRDALRALAADDLVYRKAVFQYGGAPMDQWDQLEVSVSYAFLRIALDRFREQHYRNGAFDRRAAGLDDDPYYDTMSRVVSAYTPVQLAEALDGWRTELAFATETRYAPDELLCQHIDPKRWQLSWVIAQRLAATPGDEPWRLDALLEIWAAFADDKERRTSLAKLLWPVEAWRARVILDERVRPHLGWWIDASPGTTTVEVARQVFAAMRAAGKPERVTELAPQLEDHVVVNTFLSIAPAFQATADFSGAAKLLARILTSTSPKKPDYVLIAGNLAAFQMQGGLVAECEATLDALFAHDWSRFDYKPDPKQRSFAKAFGGDLDAQYVNAFRIYYGMAKFNGACLYAQTQRPELAVAALREAVGLNPSHYTSTKLLGEADFATLHAHAGFTSLITELGGAA